MNTTRAQKRSEMYQRIDRHGENLNRIFKTGLDNETLCKKLHRLELKAHRMTVNECNGTSDHENELKAILKTVKAILNAPDGWIFVNGDARGYALKISDKVVREQNLKIERDAGGYGIIAPDYSQD